jgi:putative phosphoesterase
MTRIGLISDTHAPERLAQLPDAVFDVLRGVDFILHAGDVGELWVLDQLSRIAPVFAVHGNDDTPESQRELPYQHVIVINGQRILLTHSHYPERWAEMASRKDDAWDRKLERRANMAKRVGANIMIYGHTHVPMVKLHDGVLLINPGALASGNYLSKQVLRSVAILDAGDEARVTHIDLADGKPFVPQVDWAAGFRVAISKTNVSTLPEWLRERWYAVEDTAIGVWPQFRQALLRAGNRVWSGEYELLTPEMLLRELEREDMPAESRSRLAQALTILAT